MAELSRLQAFLDGAQVAPEVYKLRPDYRVLLMIADGITPGPSDNTSESMLQQAEESARAQLAQSPVTQLPHVAAWRDAYKAFGAKPAKFRNSLEALTRRVEGTSLPRVNRLTDIYNAISVKSQIPFGGEDLDKYEGSPRCVRATRKEKFETAEGGKVVVECPEVGEVVWVDGDWVTCRRWNWRQGLRTALTDESKSVLFILDALEPCTDEALVAAADELEAALKKLGPDVKFVRRMLDATDQS